MPRGLACAGTGKTLVARALAAQASRAGRKVTFFMRKVCLALQQLQQAPQRKLESIHHSGVLAFALPNGICARSGFGAVASPPLTPQLLDRDLSLHMLMHIFYIFQVKFQWIGGPSTPSTCMGNSSVVKYFLCFRSGCGHSVQVGGGGGANAAAAVCGSRALPALHHLLRRD